MGGGDVMRKVLVIICIPVSSPGLLLLEPSPGSSAPSTGDCGCTSSPSVDLM